MKINILAVTGHRRTGPYGGMKEYYLLRTFAEKCLAVFQPTIVLTGMAQGWDLAIAESCYTLRIPYIAYCPYPKQSEDWSNQWYGIWANCYANAKEVKFAHDKYIKECFQIRNEQMVDAADAVLALWNGLPSGTKNCIDYAHYNYRKVYNVWNLWQDFIGTPKVLGSN